MRAVRCLLITPPVVVLMSIIAPAAQAPQKIDTSTIAARWNTGV